MPENNLVERLSTIVKIADDANRAISAINSSFTFVDNLRTLLSSLTKDGNDLVTWERNLEVAQESTPSFEQRREERFNALLDVQTAVAKLTRSTYEKQGFSLDINTSFLSNLIPSAVSTLGLITVVDRYLTRREMRKGFDSLSEKLDTGFKMINTELKVGFSELNAKFDWGFSELMWRFDQQTEIEKQVRDLVANPSGTRARELRTKGMEHYVLGELEEARQALLIAIQEPANLADYIAEFYLGNIFLYQSDYDKAIFYYGESARHAEPRAPLHYYVFALMHQGFAYYIADREDKKDDFRCAVHCLKKAIDVEPHCAELRYQLAQYQALSGEVDDALENLDTIIRSDPKYIVKILAELDFVDIRQQIDEKLVAYDKELSNIFFKLFNDVTGILSQLIKICEHKGFPVQVGTENPNSNCSYIWSTTEGEAVGCDWKLSSGILHPPNTSVVQEICDEANSVLLKLEEISEIYKREDPLSKKLATDMLTEVSFSTPKKIPFDIQRGWLRLNYRTKWYTHCGQSWYDRGRWYYETSEDTKEVYVGIGGERV